MSLQGHNAVTPMRLEKTSYRPAKLGHKQHVDLLLGHSFIPASHLDKLGHNNI